jgi:hypothetical protein
MLPLFILGPGRWLDLHHEWLEAMAAHSGYLTSPDTFQALMVRYFRDAPLRHPGVLIGVVGILFAALCWWQRRTTSIQELALPLQIWTAFALVPHLVITDQEHFLYSLPLITFILAGQFRRPDPVIFSLFIGAMLLYATRSSDLWGSEREGHWVSAGALGIGNVVLLTTAWLARSREHVRQDLR